MASENHTITHHSPVVVARVDEADENPPEALHEGLAALDVSDSGAKFGRLASNMQQRCQLLLEELEQFQSCLKRQRRENHVELRTFKSSLQAEMRLLDKVSTVFHTAINLYLLILSNS
jgi:hypothetical protein